MPESEACPPNHEVKVLRFIFARSNCVMPLSMEAALPIFRVCLTRKYGARR